MRDAYEANTRRMAGALKARARIRARARRRAILRRIYSNARPFTPGA